MRYEVKKKLYITFFIAQLKELRHKYSLKKFCGVFRFIHLPDFCFMADECARQ